jgi:glycosyltransferase involved in cell wall biosynthesis
MAPLATIVIPCHGQASFLRESLDSALGQTYPRLEVIVVDDCGRDGAQAAEIAREFGVRIIRTPRVLGPGGARNAGIAATSGTYLLPLDADDVVAPDYLADSIAVLERKRFVGACYCKTQSFGGGGWSWDPPAGWSARDLMAANRLPNSCVYRRVLWAQVGGYRSELALCEDWEFWVACACRGWRFVRIPEYLLFKRIHESNLSHRLDGERLVAASRRIAARYRAPLVDRPISFEADHRA